MKNKTLISIVIILGIALVVLIGVYFVIQDKPAVDTPEEAARQNPNNAPINETTERAGGAVGGNNQAQTEQPRNKIITDEFSINLPVGWKQIAPAMGTSAMANNANENISDPAAKKINFKSYFAVSYDTLQGKNINEYIQAVKGGLQQVAPNAVFTKERDMTINGRTARAIEIELAQQGVSFRVLMVAINGQGDDVWVMSFNTVKNSWEGYEEMFYGAANSFILKNLME